ncbi:MULTISPECIES: glycine betaine ABC transporter substrate-binding protein [Brevibacillus]|jgi:osmoprotectant transport system substrate-binding protein|uniref:Glycine/betaine ABC transporter substrate-binding protein n=1 Tax=Brevibacillus thermoruber TaxID=33942 RepID=A0A9X3TP64_9BACL|nr:MULTISPECIES: glycine betaine ABC transporter substrate-binding protein [Brevibacillus]MDA5107904.1 glycine/betaine ABC transporter substrate-binding protein [Brevibacillus thermoruber]TRY26550.1 quaternary ammonium transporter [Brevibacillus sp. LEMMJ03]UYZ15226.1 glycine/betaine ABC transporter substrate-binding protein [Brevibacillus sp. WF146]
MKKRTLLSMMLVAATAFALSACGSSDSANGGGGKKEPVVVGSKNNTENVLQGEMYAQVLEANGVPVERKLNLGGTMVTFEAIKSGQVDMYPEYTGTGILAILKRPVEKDQQKVLEINKEGFKQWNIEWLDPAPLNSTYGFAMKRDLADKLGIETLTDLARHAKDLVLSYPQEFDVREDGLPGLQKAFADKGGFTFKKQFQIDYSIRYKPLLQGESDVTVSVGTDGDIAGHNLKLIKDDIGFFPVYNVAPIIRKEKLDMYPEIKEPLNKLSSLLTDEVMQKLNWEVDGPEKKEPEEVAREFLKQHELVK